jgi:DNA repair protein RecO (recombination protein O)
VATLNTQALILRIVEFGESDRILHLLVPEYGRLTVIAKGARRSVRRFSGTLDYFNHLTVQVERRRPTSMARLEQARLKQAFSEIRVDPTRFALGIYLLELLGRLAPEGGARADTERLFDFTLTALRVIASRTPDARIRILLELRMLDALGLRPELQNCVRCGKPAESAAVRFHVPEGGPLCERCGERVETQLRVHLGTLRALQQGLRFEAESLDRLALTGQALEEAQRLVGHFRRFHVGVALRSESFLDRMI